MHEIIVNGIAIEVCHKGLSDVFSAFLGKAHTDFLQLELLSPEAVSDLILQLADVLNDLAIQAINTIEGQIKEEHLNRLSGLLSKRHTGFINNIQIAHARLSACKASEDVCKRFPLLRELTAIQKVTNTGSDCHNNGQQVLIFELSDQKKFVYKPSSLLADMYIFGDMSFMRANKTLELDKNVSKFSLVEIVNHLLKDVILPPYLIVPCYSDEGPFGLMEYIGGRPEPDYDLKSDVRSVLADKKIIGDKYQFAAYFELKMEKALQEFLQNEPPKALIINSDESSKQYSYQCGLLAGIVRYCRVSDLHVDDFRPSGPYVLDCEECDAKNVVSIQETYLLLPHIGAMSLAARSKIFIPILHNKESLEFKVFGKNLRFRVNDKNKYEPCPLDKELFKQGFRKLLSLSIEKEEPKMLFQKWYANFCQECYARDVPVSTSTFLKLKREYIRTIMSGGQKLQEDQGIDRLSKQQSREAFEAISILDVPFLQHKLKSPEKVEQRIDEEDELKKIDEAFAAITAADLERVKELVSAQRYWEEHNNNIDSMLQPLNLLIPRPRICRISSLFVLNFQFLFSKIYELIAELVTFD